MDEERNDILYLDQMGPLPSPRFITKCALCGIIVRMRERSVVSDVVSEIVFLVQVRWSI